MCELTYEAYHGRKAPLWWRMCRRHGRLNQFDRWARRKLAQPVPIWIAFVLFAFWCVAVGKLCVMVGGIR